MKSRILYLSFLLVLSSNTYADVIDLSSWTGLKLDYSSSGGDGPGSWDLNDTTKVAVAQEGNADPSFYLNNLNQTAYSMSGFIEVRTTGDNDFFGFVFGYQNSSNFYLFDWKKETQAAYGGIATEGMTIKKVTGLSGDAYTDLTLAEFWDNGSAAGDIFGDVEMLAVNHGASTGWQEYERYNVFLDFNIHPGEIHVVINDESNITLWDVTVFDTTFTSGQFGFYNHSQQFTRYDDFEQIGGTVVPLPASLWFMVTGLAGIGFALRRKPE